MMRNSVKMLVVPALVLAAACGRDEKPIDQALQNDLSLASQMNQPQQFVSPVEMGYGGYGAAPQGYAQQPYGYYPQAPQPVAQRIYRAPTAARTSSGTASGTRTTGTRVIKHTKRDAIIGGVAGAAIGAVTSRDKLKGAVIGGVAGSVLGAVIGNNVDVKKIPF